MEHKQNSLKDPVLFGILTLPDDSAVKTARHLVYFDRATDM